MKKLLMMLIVLSIIYIGIQMVFKYFGYGHTINYQVETDGYVFNIEEKYTLNRDHEINNYYFNIKVNDSIFSFQTYENFDHTDRIIKKIRYYKDEQHECILPIFENDIIIFDFMCIRDKQITYYHNLVGENPNLDKFVINIVDKNYGIKNWLDDKSNSIGEAPITVYSNNILKNHFIGVNNYRGLYTINNLNLKKIVDIKIFNRDIYERKISAIVNKYYVSADYEQSYQFNKFYIIDLTSNEIETTTGTKKISFNSYIQGIVDNSLYIFDRDNKRQYEVNTKTNKIIETGNESVGIKIYDNGNWLKVEANEAVNADVLFKNDYETNSNTVYERIDKFGNVLSGYYYYYQKNGDMYDVYRANVQDQDLKTYLFSTSEIENINYVRDYVYYSENNEVKYYHDKTGVRTIFKNDEFEFNKSLYYNIYLKK